MSTAKRTGSIAAPDRYDFAGLSLMADSLRPLSWSVALKWEALPGTAAVSIHWCVWGERISPRRDASLAFGRFNGLHRGTRRWKLTLSWQSRQGLTNPLTAWASSRVTESFPSLVSEDLRASAAWNVKTPKSYGCLRPFEICVANDSTGTEGVTRRRGLESAFLGVRYTIALA